MATIGRQNLHVAEQKLRKLVSVPSGYKNQIYCEELLTKYLSASSVVSFDNSDYEQATYVADMNKPLADHRGEFDTVIDGGTAEHVFNVAQALKNISDLCAPGGQILHILPANNFCGHGFWQFSPELFFSLYSEQNGFKDTQVFMADLERESVWYEVLKPPPGGRVNIHSSSQIYALCRTVKTAAVSQYSVHQSDYVHKWDASKGIASQDSSDLPQGAVGKLKAKLKMDGGFPLRRTVYWLYNLYRTKFAERLSGRNKYLRKRRVAALLDSL